MNCVYARLCTHLWCVCVCARVFTWLLSGGERPKRVTPNMHVYIYICIYLYIYIYTYMVEVIIATVGRKYVT